MVDDGDPDCVPDVTFASVPARGDQELAATVPGVATPDEETLVPAARSASGPIALPPATYHLGVLIGRGGMGEILAAQDQRIGRDVAIKRMRSATPDAEQVARFLREARIQARLDHPAIVPVHELGVDGAGRPYFTMKRVSGKTLSERLAEAAPLHGLLRAFVDVCLAIDLAHSRSVIHRDLKPANIMLGDYGEVYVLDWGLARVLADDHEVARDLPTLDEDTQTGTILGTPGYMSPEQIQGVPVTPAADVYSLGAILFELLAAEPLHPRGQAAIPATMSSPQEAPAKRRPDRAIAPELDAICHASLARDPASRPTARELADRVQAYLDGDRDLERRRALAEQHLARARACREQGGGPRATAIREAGQALALSPSPEAASLLAMLLVEPPDPLPRELETVLEAEERKLVSQRTRAGVSAYLMLFALLPVIPFMTVKSWGWLIALYVVAGGLAFSTYISSRRGTYNLALGLLGNLVFTVLWSRLAGTFVLTPVVACGVLLGLTTTSWLSQRRWMIICYAAATVLVPLGLEGIGWMPSSVEVSLTSIVSRSSIFRMDGLLADASLIGATIIFTSVVGLVAARIHGAAKAAKRALSIQAWQLKQLVPEAASSP